MSVTPAERMRKWRESRFRSAIRGLLQRLDASPTRWLAYGVVAGIASGLTSVVFFVGLELAGQHVFGSIGRHLPSPPGEVLFGEQDEPLVTGVDPESGVGRWLFFVLPAIGGLISGLLVTRYAPEAAGHGTDEMIRAFHRDRGVIRPRVPLVKGLATIATLATGGSAGKEGPIAQIGAGIGSFLATRLGLSARDRRVLLLAGAAGGLGSIFRAPLGSAITAIEVLYQEDFEADALIPCVISSVTAYAVFVTLLGSARIFDVPPIPLPMVQELPGYLLLALLTVPIGGLYIRLFYGTRAAFARLPVAPWLRPVLGGLGVGLIGLWAEQVYGSGWGYIQQVLDGSLIVDGQPVGSTTALVTLLAGIALAKIAATCLTIGSGGSGGVFGPTLFIGGMLGGVVGYGGNLFAPQIFPVPEAYVLVGMASFFAGVASAPIGAMLMVTEMTGGYTLLPPLMLASVVAIVFMRHTSIYENQVRDRFRSPAHVGDLTINVLEEMKVADVFRPNTQIACVPPEARFGLLRDAILVSEEATLPVISASGELVGLVTAEQIRPVMDDVQLDQFVVARDICAPPVFVRPDDDLYRAHELFRQSGCPQIPVLGDLTGEGQGGIVGLLDYRDMMRAYGRELIRRKSD